MMTITRPRILRVIARLNLGGPAHHVGVLSGRLMSEQFETLLVAGEVGEGEASARDVVLGHGARLQMSAALGPRIDPRRDAQAMAHLVRIVREFRPDVVHTHTAKAGLLGRAAALAGSPRPVIVHTYHGHVLEGYFGAAQERVYRMLERRLAAVSDRLIGVSQATVDDLIRLGIAPAHKFAIIPLGLDLARFSDITVADGEAFRREIGAFEDDVVLTFVGRLVAVKRVEFLLEAFACARLSSSSLRLAVVGDGELRPALERRARELGIGDAVSFLGYRTSLEEVYAGTNLAVLTSANEGTPVALIEASAAAVPAVATRVGGVSDVVSPATGVLVDAHDVAGFARALVLLASDPGRRRTLGQHARGHVLSRYTMDRLTADVTELYDELLAGHTSERHHGRSYGKNQCAG